MNKNHNNNNNKKSVLENNVYFELPGLVFLTSILHFVQVDSLLGARGGAFEHEATRRMRNEFMAAWDGLRSKDSQRLLILGATNRPFDLDDAVIRRLPRRSDCVAGFFTFYLSISLFLVVVICDS